MKEAGRITGESILLAAEAIRPGVTTKQLDTIIRRHIESQGAKPSFLGYGGFPGSACISINDQVIHGIPGPRVIDEGDIVKIDVGAFYKGFHGDSANTFPCGRISAEAQRLMDQGRSVVLEIDVQGGINVRRVHPDAVLVFIEPPSAEELERRLRGRGTEDEASIQMRLANATKELGYADSYDVRIVNDDLDRAVAELAHVIDTYETDGGPF